MLIIWARERWYNRLVWAGYILLRFRPWVLLVALLCRKPVRDEGRSEEYGGPESKLADT